MTDGTEVVTVTVKDMPLVKAMVEEAKNEGYEEGFAAATRAARMEASLKVEADQAHARGADVELIEYSDTPEDVQLVIPNAIVINGQKTWLSADHPIEVEYKAERSPDGEGIDYHSLATVTMTVQCRSLKVEARKAPEDIQPKDTFK